MPNEAEAVGLLALMPLVDARRPRAPQAWSASPIRTGPSGTRASGRTSSETVAAASRKTALYVSMITVKTRCRAIFRKLGVSDRKSAAQTARDRHLH